MRIDKYGMHISLRDEVMNIITDSLPQSDGNESFLNSEDIDKMVDGILEIIGEHIDYNMDTRRMVE